MTPSPSVKPYVTRHRKLVNDFLAETQSYIAGRVLDIGGKRISPDSPTGFIVRRSRELLVLNMDPQEAPDLLCDAAAIPLPDGHVDCFLLCEVVEHVPEPHAILAEAFRVLRAGGHGLVTVPFLFPIHADPDDFQRLTEAGLRRACGRAGFQVVDLRPLGSSWDVIADLLYTESKSLAGSRPVASKAAQLLSRIVRVLVRTPLGESANGRCPSGYGIVLRK